MLLFPNAPTPSVDPTEENEKRALVALYGVPGLGPSRIRTLVAEMGSGYAVLNAPIGSLQAVEGVGRMTAEAIATYDEAGKIDRQFEAAKNVGAELITLHDSRYPTLLKKIYDPPPFLWTRGKFKPEDEYAVAIVGTRKATEYGRRAAEYFAKALVERGFTIVSGLAYGIDVAAHRAALEAGGRTIVVLGSGVDRIYPSAHKDVVDRILADDRGAIISEFPMGAKPDATNFPRRNRIIAGISKGTLVAEARESGGALITAFEAIEQNREVFAVPSPFNSETIGTNTLIRNGHAALISTVDDVLSEIGGPPDQSPEPTDTAKQRPIVKLNRAEGMLYEALGPDPVHLDVLCEKTGLDAPSALVYLLNLEFQGLVRQLAGKQFFKV
ncbi:MAG: DNA-processing protein DprA [Rubricoccaceae bacterium]|nr:DNA-processing protein DprA [Rubricoccaceae bacterium]